MIPKQLDPSLFRRHAHHARHAASSPGLVSRRGFIGRVAGGAGVLVGSSLIRPGAALAAPKSNPAPRPTTQTVELNGVTFHLTFFGPDVAPAVITDFNGFVGVADVQGTGTATNPDGSTETLLFDTDMRFMQGTYVGQDERIHHGTFSFI